MQHMKHPKATANPPDSKSKSIYYNVNRKKTALHDAISIQEQQSQK